MSAGVVVAFAVLGAAAGWFVIAPLTERVPVPNPLPRAGTIAVTVTSAVLWALVVHHFGRWWAVVPYLVVFSALLAVSVVDLRLYRIPDRIVFPSLLAALVLFGAGALALHEGSRIRSGLVGLAAYFGILFVFHLISPRGMGFGDVKLALLMGFSLGWLADDGLLAVDLALVALFIGCVLGIVFGLIVRIVRRRAGAFPFGPALALGTIYLVLALNGTATGGL